MGDRMNAYNCEIGNVVYTNFENGFIIVGKNDTMIIVKIKGYPKTSAKRSVVGGFTYIKLIKYA